MSYYLASPPRYRLIPHPDEGYSGVIYDDTAEELSEMKCTALRGWMRGELLPAHYTGETTTAYGTGGNYHNAHLWQVGDELRAYNPLLTPYLRLPEITTTVGADTRLFGLTGDGMLIVALASMNPEVLRRSA